MNELLKAVYALVLLVSPEKIRAIASKIRQSDVTDAISPLTGVVGTPVAADQVVKLLEAWRASDVKADELASMLLAASYTSARAAAEQSIELVWTGPKTHVVAPRRTEQALLQVINAAQNDLFVTSFVAYDVSGVVKALNAAAARGVSVCMLLESSHDQGGSIAMDVIGKMRVLVPAAKLYGWREKADEFSEGRVHAKVAVADGLTCFITSANLTGYAMARNMEAGVVIRGGPIPKTLHDHLHALVDIKVVAEV